MTEAKGYLTTPNVVFNYKDPAPTGTKLNILTKGNICITSIWQNNMGHKGWAPLPHRDREIEKELGIL